MTGSTTGRGQLRHLVALRIRMVRSPASRLGFGLLAVLPLVLTVLAVYVGQHAPQTKLINIALITPTLYLAFAVLTVLAPLAAGGGNELYPPDQLVAYPVRPATTFLASLLLAPLNLAWTTQVITLMGATSFLLGPGLVGLVCALLTCATFVVATTITGQMLAWGVVGVRAQRRGRVGIWVLAGLAGAIVLAVISTGRTLSVLDGSPTTSVLLIAFAGGNGQLGKWAFGTWLLVALAVFSYLAGTRVCGWALRRPGDGRAEHSSRNEVRRRPARTPLAELRRVDRASVWRSAALRRGLYILTLVPAAVALASRLDWRTLIFIPGLVAAGAGLLFGVNAFCLDATGAVWLSSLPHDPLLAFRSKALVLTEVCGGAVVVSVVTSSLRTRQGPTVVDAVALVAVAVAAVASVVATCMKLSVTQPHRADLRGSRDAPAPPGVMAVHSARLAVSTTFLAVFVGATTIVGEWWAPALAGTAVVLQAARSLVRTRRWWSDPFVRSRVVATVAAG